MQLMCPPTRGYILEFALLFVYFIVIRNIVFESNFILNMYSNFYFITTIGTALLNSILNYNNFSNNFMFIELLIIIM